MREIQILLAEDNRADIVMVQEALAAHDIAHQLQIAVNGEEAIAFIKRMGKPDQSPCPDIFLLDLNLPRVDGLDVLREFRRHPECAATPVIVMSSSNSLREREAADALGVSRYFAKPSSYDSFTQLGRIVRDVLGGN